MPRDSSDNNCGAIARIIKDFCSCSENGTWSPVGEEDIGRRVDGNGRETFLKSELTNIAAMRKRLTTIAKRKSRYIDEQPKPTMHTLPNGLNNDFYERDNVPKFIEQRDYKHEEEQRKLIDRYSMSRNYSRFGDNWSLSRVWKSHLPENFFDSPAPPSEIMNNGSRMPLLKSNGKIIDEKLYKRKMTEKVNKLQKFRYIDKKLMKEQLRYDRNIKRHIRIRFMLSLRLRRYMKRKFPSFYHVKKPIMIDYDRTAANIPAREFPKVQRGMSNEFPKILYDNTKEIPTMQQRMYDKSREMPNMRYDATKEYPKIPYDRASEYPNFRYETSNEYARLSMEQLNEFPKMGNVKSSVADSSTFGTRSLKSVDNENNGVVVFDINEARNEILSRCHYDWEDCDTLQIALRGGNFRSGRLAVETWAGEMPATRAANGALALHYAAARGCLDCVRLLAATTPDVSANTAMDNDVTPVYLAAQEGHLEVLKYLVLEAGGKLNARAKDGMLPIHAAAQTGCLDCVKWMIMDQSVDPNSRDGDGATPLHFAASRGHLSTVRWLLRHGARLQLDRHGKSPINDAAENHHVECLNVLVAAGAGSEGKQLATYKGAHACACTPGDSRCPLPSCVNANQNRSRSPDRAPFFLHPPAIQHGTHHSQHSSQNGQHGTQHSQHGTQHSPHGTQHSQHGTQHSQHGTQHGQHVNHHGQHGKQHGQNGNQHGQHGAAQHASLAPADGLYVNPMQKKPQEVHVNSSATSNNGSASSGEESSVSSSLGTSSHGTGFYLHSPQEVIYNRVRDLFDGPGTPTSLARGRAEGQETPNGMTVKAEVHSSSSGAGSEGSESGVSEGARRDADHDYEDIYLAREDIHRQRSKSRDSGSHSRSGSASSSGGGVVIQLTPQLTTRDGAKSSVSKRSSQNGKKNTYEESHSKPSSKMNGKSPKGEKSGGSKSASSGHSTQSSAGGRQSSLSGRLSSLGAKASSFANKLASSRSSLQEEAGSGESGVSSASCSSDEAAPPPPPPPPPAPAALEVLEEPTVRPSEFINRIGARCNSSAGSSEADADGERPSRGGPNLVNKQLVLPFVPPSFPHNSASNRLIKPSEYLRSITTSSSKQSSDAEDGYTIINQMKRSDSRDRSEEAKENGPAFCPPPPPPPPPQENANNNKHQPLSSISIQDLNSVQLRRTDKMIASKTLSAPARSMSMQCLATEPFQAQKTDLIAELKMSKDITGIKKMKVERAKMENMVEKEVYSEYTKQFTTENFVDQIPERDPSGNIIPAWKRQMLARRAAERARRDLERRLAGEAERRRAMAVPAWKRQLLARREEAENRIKATIYTPKVCDEPRNGFLAHETNTDACWRSPSQYGVQQRAVSIDNINLAVDYEDRRTNGVNDNTDHHNGVNESDVKENTIVNGGKPVTNGRKHSVESGDDARIIPWRAQLRKTNSKLNLLE